MRTTIAAPAPVSLPRALVYPPPLMRFAYLAICASGCAALPVSMVVKPPLESQCHRLPIKGCGELVDGVLLYADGDRAGAMQKVELVRRENTPADLQKFGEGLRAAAGLPGADSIAQPLNELADLLGAPASPPATARVATALATTAASTSNTRVVAAEPPASVTSAGTMFGGASEREEAVARALSASSDPNRIFSESYDLSAQEGRMPCKIEGVDAVCFKGREGPLLVTDVIGATACPERMFIGATESDTTLFGFHWLFETRTTPITSARFVVRGGEWLQFAILPGKKGLSGSPECQVSWSGFRPWVVPGMAAAPYEQRR
jgi:hypothetical protein